MEITEHRFVQHLKWCLPWSLSFLVFFAEILCKQQIRSFVNRHGIFQEENIFLSLNEFFIKIRDHHTRGAGGEGDRTVHSVLRSDANPVNDINLSWLTHNLSRKSSFSNSKSKRETRYFKISLNTSCVPLPCPIPYSYSLLKLNQFF